MIDRHALDKILVAQHVALVPRPRGTKSVSAGFKLTEAFDGKVATLEEISAWKDEDRAAVAGINNLLVFDFDSREAYEQFWGLKEKAADVQNQTFTVKTHRGISNWFFDLSIDISKFQATINVRPVLDLEIFIQKHIAACPGNLHPSGSTYELLGTTQILRKDGILEQAIERLRSLGWRGSPYKSSIIESNSVENWELSKELPDSEINEIARKIAPFYKRGVRHKFIFAVCGLMIREHRSEETAIKVLSAIHDLVDSTAQDRTAMKSQVHNRYKHPDPAKQPGTNYLSTIMREANQT